VMAGILFSIGNALFEEIVFRGIVFDSLVPHWGKAVAVVLSSAAFALGHLHGYPPGVFGAVLAVVFGTVLGCMRCVTGGIGLGVAVHVAADATIYMLIVRAGGV
jgi:membrane protease YdiL (CAAX protease family)